jgi:6-phosphogluconate dehydrogenase
MGETKTMQLGMIGLGRMGVNIVRRLIKGGRECVVLDRFRLGFRVRNTT